MSINQYKSKHMKIKLLLLLILTISISAKCQQEKPDTMIYYSKAWGDEMAAVNHKQLQTIDSLNRELNICKFVLPDSTIVWADSFKVTIFGSGLMLEVNKVGKNFHIKTKEGSIRLNCDYIQREFRVNGIDSTFTRGSSFINFR